MERRRAPTVAQTARGPEGRSSLHLNSLLGYETGPGSVIYLAYNHYELGRAPYLGEPDRVFFLKVAYLFTR